MLGETIRLSIGLRLVVDLLHMMYVKDKEMLEYDFIVDLSWTG
jgi:hypothetical protein